MLMKSLFNKIFGFLREVREEILKCTRPSAAELKESIIVVVVTMTGLGCFIFGVDYVINLVLKWAITRVG